MRTSANRPLLGILLITSGSLFGAISDALTKLLTTNLSVAQIVFWQSTVVLLAVLALCVVRGRRTLLASASWGLQVARGAAHVATSFLFVAGLAVLPFSTAVTLWFANPLFTAALAPLLLGERSSVGRWGLVLTGFGGVAVIASPSAGVASIWVAYPLGAALCGAIRDMLTRTMSEKDSSESMIFYSALTMVVASGIVGGGNAGMTGMATADIFLLAASGVIYLAALYLIAESLRHAQASSVAPFKYTTIVWATVIDVLVWRNLPSWNVFAGALIVVAAMYALYRLEAREHAVR